MEYALSPVISPDTRILILGSGPSVLSLKRQQYYGNPRNSFWPLMESLCSRSCATYAERLEMVKSRGISIWDVLAEFDRKGSSDAAYKKVVANPLKPLMEGFEHLECVAFTGKAACRFYEKLVAFYPPGVDFLTLPSSSPAYVKPFEWKKERWEVLIPYMKGDLINTFN